MEDPYYWKMTFTTVLILLCVLNNDLSWMVSWYLSLLIYISSNIVRPNTIRFVILYRRGGRVQKYEQLCYILMYDPLFILFQSAKLVSVLFVLSSKKIHKTNCVYKILCQYGCIFVCISNTSIFMECDTVIQVDSRKQGAWFLFWFVFSRGPRVLSWIFSIVSFGSTSDFPRGISILTCR